MTLLAAVAIGAGSGLAQGVTRPDAPQAPMPREVVMLVGHAIEDLEDGRPDPARALLQMPLNHLGLRLSRVGVDGDAPPDLDPAVVCAFGTWFENQQELPDWVWPWLERQPPALRILHFGSLQPLARADDGQRLRAWLQRRGLGADRDHPGVIQLVRIGDVGAPDGESEERDERDERAPPDHSCPRIPSDGRIGNVVTD